MNLNELAYCPCTLETNNKAYSPAGLRLMFDRKKVSHVLDFNSPGTDEEAAEKLRQNSKGISISGAQFKQSLTLQKNKLRLTEPGEPGKYILKPIPTRLPFGNEKELPANEHLTMQIAKQVYGIATAECALVFFKNGEPAYLTRRFDYTRDGRKIAQEDFASITGLSKEMNGESFKNKGSYEDIARSMKKYVAAYIVEIEKFFERVVFNYLFSNGDAHLKNFSLQQSPSGDYLLSPAYDMLNTRIHIPDDSFFALKDGLFTDGYATNSFKELGFYAYDDFYEFGLKIGIAESRVTKLLHKYRGENSKTVLLIQQSFLSHTIKELYLAHYNDRLRMLNNSFGQLI